MLVSVSAAPVKRGRCRRKEGNYIEFLSCRAFLGGYLAVCGKAVLLGSVSFSDKRLTYLEGELVLERARCD